MGREVLKIENLWVSVNGKVILKGVDMVIKEGEVHVLFGPNGSGKSTLLGAIMGLPRYKIEKGRIYFMGKDITHLPVYERAKMGIGLAFQKPPIVKGVKLLNLIKLMNKSSYKIEEIADILNMRDFLDRDLNDGFSGGEVKRAELMQLLAQNPRFVMLDEPESGVDLENISLISKAINLLFEKDKKIVERKKSALIITHTGYILDYITAEVGHVLFDGEVICYGYPYDILEVLKK